MWAGLLEPLQIKLRTFITKFKKKKNADDALKEKILREVSEQLKKRDDERTPKIEWFHRGGKGR
jgi:hypothetical protein